MADVKKVQPDVQLKLDASKPTIWLRIEDLPPNASLMVFEVKGGDATNCLFDLVGNTTRTPSADVAVVTEQTPDTKTHFDAQALRIAVAVLKDVDTGPVQVGIMRKQDSQDHAGDRRVHQTVKLFRGAGEPLSVWQHLVLVNDAAADNPEE